MRIALIADTFPPLRTSGAVQLRDLSREFARQGHALTVLLPSPEQDEPWSLEEADGVQVLRLKAPRTKDIGYVRRTLAEFSMPFAMLRQFQKSPLASEQWDGVVWYAGNMGVAQGMDILLDLAERLRHRTDVGFLFVGRGSDAARLRSVAEERQLDNVLFCDEIHPDEIPDLYSQCSAGMVALDPRHKSHNIPGKFLTYMQSGLPVLANVNAGNDLAKLIRDEQVGHVCESNQVGELLQLTDKLLAQMDSEAAELQNRCRSLFEREFAVDRAVGQIVAALMA